MSSVSMIDGHIDEQKLTDNEIIRRLELFIQNDICSGNCEKCNFIEDGEMCLSHLIRGVSDLINRKKEQINGLIAGQETLQKHLVEKNAEIERLKAENKFKAKETIVDSNKNFWEDTH